jgi:hypothetical protein
VVADRVSRSATTAAAMPTRPAFFVTWPAESCTAVTTRARRANTARMLLLPCSPWMRPPVNSSARDQKKASGTPPEQSR